MSISAGTCASIYQGKKPYFSNWKALRAGTKADIASCDKFMIGVLQLFATSDDGLAAEEIILDAVSANGG